MTDPEPPDAPALAPDHSALPPDQAEARALIRRFKSMMSIDTGGDDDSDAADEVALGDLEALQGVVKFPVRIKCAVLGWNTLNQALDEAAAH